MGFRKGSIVRSKAVGIRKSFEGKIIEVCRGYENKKYFRVEDPHGEVWIRHSADLFITTPKGEIDDVSV